ncbi:polysaccharide deacetylase 2 family uncharacterized protein YibQ [Rhodovulum bhavnagarense]|uniref:Polysaccharide deacetylase 2 family uncharacterized protein YibQ n=1 Tax=Rhodovulum bhavnagarense TaxID=992286 RepID=A0A4V2SWF0_9RHOB|nr:divergent polysaccharide deacetylase family protein [Rhodovulum bhavnagarense]TCP62016.1 polysaccharide deacetylase 2 family uncharacterized protein YibQ [Rhodovulum bhavnagarense]
MGKGLVSGVVWGSLVSGLVLVVLAVTVPPPPQVMPGAVLQTSHDTVTGPSAGSGEPSPPEDDEQAKRGDSVPPASPAAPEPDLAMGPVTPGAADIPAPATAPETEIDLPAGSGFASPGALERVNLPGEAPAPRAAPGAVVTAPPPPETGTPDTSDTMSAEIPAPVLEGPAAMRPPADESVSPSGDAGQEPERPSPELPSPPQPATAALETPAAPDPKAPFDVPQPEIIGESQQAPNPQAGTQTTPSPQPAPSVSPLGLPATGFDQPVPGVRTGRLPTVTEDGTKPEDRTGAEPDPTGRISAASPGQEASQARGALGQFAVPFEAPGAGPLIAIVLIDAGAEGLDMAALRGLSFPVSFGVDPIRPDAESRVAAHLDAGQEVVTLVSGLPDGATARDIEVTMPRLLERTQGSVGILDAMTGGYQDSRELSAQMVALAQETGHGLLTYDRGLNGAARIAGQAGVPSATVYRVLDAMRENRFAIKRKLDRAVFKARQDGHVVLVAHTYPETVSALVEWALEGNAGDVRLVPVSVILMQR